MCVLTEYRRVPRKNVISIFVFRKLFVYLCVISVLVARSKKINKNVAKKYIMPDDGYDLCVFMS